MKTNPLWAVGWYFVFPVMKLLFFLKINGKENIPKKGPFIICSNHLSYADPVLLAMIQHRQIFFMAKAELFKNKLFSWLIRILGAFPVQRGAGDGKAINEAEEILKKGGLLGIFIEGTRSKTGELLRPKSGPAMIAQQMNAPVIPVCITPKTKKVKVFSKVTISVSKPLTPDELGLAGETSGEALRNASKRIMSEMQSMRYRDFAAMNKSKTAETEEAK